MNLNSFIFLIQGLITLGLGLIFPEYKNVFLTLGLSVILGISFLRISRSEKKYLEETKLLSFSSILAISFILLFHFRLSDYFTSLILTTTFLIPILSFFFKDKSKLSVFIVLSLFFSFLFSLKSSNNLTERSVWTSYFSIVLIFIYIINKKRIDIQFKNNTSKNRLSELINSFPDTLIDYNRNEFTVLNRSTFKMSESFQYELKKFLLLSKNQEEVFSFEENGNFYQVKKLESKNFNNLLYLRDITIEKNKELEIERNRQQLTNSSKLAALGEMAGGVAHEINNPLQILGLSIEQMRLLNLSKNRNIQEYDKLCDQMESTVDRVTNIIKGMKLISRDGKQDPFEKLDVRDVVHETLSFCKERFKNAGVKIFYFEEDLPDYWIAGQKVRLSQVILNLLNNAYDALSKYKDKKIRVGLESTDSHIRIFISDNGPGVPDEVVDKIFQPFFTTKDIGKGTGLGLSISKGIIEQHQGTFYLSEDHRSKFVIEIPKYKIEVKNA